VLSLALFQAQEMNVPMPSMLNRSSSLVALLACSLLAGCKATPPNKVETKTINWTKHHLTVHGKKTPNPTPATPDSIANGKQMFGSYCMVCHGLDGQNTGVPFAKTVSPPVPSLASPEVQGYTDGQLQWIIKNGISPSGMPPSTGEFSDDDMWDMVNYIRHLPPAGSLGEPNVYGGSGGGGAK
jgi:mono/diheme cytochrome c family protein